MSLEGVCSSWTRCCQCTWKATSYVSGEDEETTVPCSVVCKMGTSTFWTWHYLSIHSFLTFCQLQHLPIFSENTHSSAELIYLPWDTTEKTLHSVSFSICNWSIRIGKPSYPLSQVINYPARPCTSSLYLCKLSQLIANNAARDAEFLCHKNFYRSTWDICGEAPQVPERSRVLRQMASPFPFHKRIQYKLFSLPVQNQKMQRRFLLFLPSSYGFARPERKVGCFQMNRVSAWHCNCYCMQDKRKDC